MSERPLHIVLANTGYPPHSGFGGIAIYQYYLSQALAQKGQQVTIVSARWNRNAPTEEQRDGIRVLRILNQHRYWLHRLPLMGHYMRAMVQFLYSCRVARLLQRLSWEFRPDIVEFADAGAEGFVFSGFRPFPMVVRCHTPTFVLRRYYTATEMPYDTRFTTWMEKQAIRRAGTLTAPSRDMACTIAADCSNVSAGDFTVIPNALDVQQFDTGKRKRPSPGEPIYILHVGRFERVKGINVLAEVIPRVVRQSSNARFVFIGEESGGRRLIRERLQQTFREEGVLDAVIFAGSVGHDGLLGWYQKAQIAVVPSLLYESFSYTCAQAMAAELPVVASRIGGIPETVEDNVSGLLTEPGDVQGVTDALLRLLEDPEVRQKMGKAGKETAVRRFRSDRVADTTLDCYRSLQ